MDIQHILTSKNIPSRSPIYRILLSCLCPALFVNTAIQIPESCSWHSSDLPLNDVLQKWWLDIKSCLWSWVSASIFLEFIPLEAQKRNFAASPAMLAGPSGMIGRVWISVVADWWLQSLSTPCHVPVYDATVCKSLQANWLNPDLQKKHSS